jgi:hypothetical protein
VENDNHQNISSSASERSQYQPIPPPESSSSMKLLQVALLMIRSIQEAVKPEAPLLACQRARQPNRSDQCFIQCIVTALWQRTLDTFETEKVKASYHSHGSFELSGRLHSLQSMRLSSFPWAVPPFSHSSPRQQLSYASPVGTCFDSFASLLSTLSILGTQYCRYRSHSDSKYLRSPAAPAPSS